MTATTLRPTLHLDRLFGETLQHPYLSGRCARSAALVFAASIARRTLPHLPPGDLTKQANEIIDWACWIGAVTSDRETVHRSQAVMRQTHGSLARLCQGGDQLTRLAGYVITMLVSEPLDHVVSDVAAGYLRRVMLLQPPGRDEDLEPAAQEIEAMAQKLLALADRCNASLGVRERVSI